MKKFMLKVLRRMFASETLLLYRSHSLTGQTSPTEIKMATPENINDVLFFDSRTNVEKFQRFLAHGDSGYLAYLGETCVHRSWVKCVPEKVFLHWALPMELQENEAYIHFCETAPMARGKNIFAHVLSRISEEYQHCNNVYICVNNKNKASIRSIEKAGYVKIKSYRIIALANSLIYKNERG
ncbi:MAG TPA: hypothetical protein PLD52_08920 [Bacteroidales bacterium]|nr:hypothetical protein [Bacteroidales bacterium]